MLFLAQEGGAIDAVFRSFEDASLWVIFGIALVALAFAFYLRREVLAAPEGTEKMKSIARAIQEGAKAYLNRQFRTVGVFMGILTVALFFVLPVPKVVTNGHLYIPFGRSISVYLVDAFSAT